MPIPRELRKFYGHRWRTVTRPRILARAGNACERCARRPGLPAIGRSRKVWGVPSKVEPLDIAHLVIPPGQPGHDDDDNLAALCRQCHRTHDYKAWAAKCHETRAARKDAARPIQWTEGVLIV